MSVETKTFSATSEGNTDTIDITAQVQDAVKKSKIKSGIAVVFVAGSTAAISTIEYEPGLRKDIPAIFENVAPRNYDYAHHRTWGCDNGSAHVRSTLVGTSFTVPFKDKNLILGTWQQICLIDFDTRARKRDIVVQILGD